MFYYEFLVILKYMIINFDFFTQVEALDDPVKPVEAILSRCNKTQIMEKYCVPNYSDTLEFLTLFAKRLGKLKKGNDISALCGFFYLVCSISFCSV